MPNRDVRVIVGHCGKDPEYKTTPSGLRVCNVSIATSYGKKDDRKTEWTRCVAFDDFADLLQENFSKGSAIHVEGPSRTREWADKQGVKRYTTELSVYYLAKPLYKARTNGQGETVEDQVDGDVPF